MKAKKTTCKEQAKQGEQIRNADGKFRKGVSGNVHGRPKGAVNRVVSMVKDAAENIALPALIENAQSGDMEAIKLLFLAGVPRLKPVELAEPIDINPNDTIEGKIKSIFKLLANGEITAAKGVELANIVSQSLKVIDMEDLINRIEQLEKQANKGK